VSPVNPDFPGCVARRGDPGGWLVQLEAMDEVSGIASLAMRIQGEERWTPMDMPEFDTTSAQGSAVAGTIVEFQAVNGAGLDSETTHVVPQHLVCEVTPPSEGGEEVTASDSSADGGCRTTSGGTTLPAFWFGLAALWLFARRRFLTD
jgi:hypothetical protein